MPLENKHIDFLRRNARPVSERTWMPLFTADNQTWVNKSTIKREVPEPSTAFRLESGLVVLVQSIATIPACGSDIDPTTNRGYVFDSSTDYNSMARHERLVQGMRPDHSAAEDFGWYICMTGYGSEIGSPSRRIDLPVTLRGHKFSPDVPLQGITDRGDTHIDHFTPMVNSPEIPSDENLLAPTFPHPRLSTEFQRTGLRLVISSFSKNPEIPKLYGIEIRFGTPGTPIPKAFRDIF